MHDQFFHFQPGTLFTFGELGQLAFCRILELVGDIGDWQRLRHA